MFPSFPIALIALIISIFALIKGSDLFLNAASKIAKHFGTTEFFIGLTLVAISTSLPELATSITATFAKHPGIIMGNIIGSNIANIGLVLGLTLVFTTIFVKKYEYEKIFIMLLSILLFSLFATDLQISRFEAVILFGAFLLYFGSIFKVRDRIRDFRKYFFTMLELRGLLSLQRIKEIKQEKDHLKKGQRLKKRLAREAFLYELVREFAVLVFGLVLIVLGAKFTVESAVDIALFMHISETVVATVFIAVGTSLPELFVSITGIIKGYKKMILGNLIGSNVFNTLAIIGFVGILKPITFNSITLKFLIPAMLVFSFLLYIFLKKSHKLEKIEGITLFVLYASFLAVLFLTSIAVG
ncbi:hypothetical protein B6U80_00740 [Candidatus Pacearchaeota archaeon ex4484_26]|nr:MAG: hypothetical protein B6U80_00740 [Candidatus Pacearchaeota archaeon ex4484_26]RLF35951.1 MAG: hypothetical protein DRM99_03730 [Thermoplasmata archaeon]